jgi:hypothetical protein
VRGFISPILVAFLAAPSVAQVQLASIEGTVIDASGLAVPGAAVDLVDPATNQHRTTVTDNAGVFRLSNLAPSAYVLRVELSGFAPFEQRDLTLAVGQTSRIHVVLSIRSIKETVSVSTQPPALDPSRTAVASVIDTERVEELPVRSRNYLEFALLAPGVTPSQAGGRSATPTTALTDSGFSFAGLRPRSNLLTIDGLTNNDEFSGASRTELSLEIVREFQVVTSGWSAESGGASGGAINVVTKSGTNTLHGDAFLFGQSGQLNAAPKLEDTFGERPSLTRFRGGLAVGGPLVKDRTFYYAAGEQEYTRAEAAADTGASIPREITNFLRAGGLPGLATRALTVGLFPTALDETELSAKMTHQLNARQSLMLRVAATNTDDTADAFNTGGLSDFSARGTSGTRDIALTGSWTSVLGTRMTNDLRAQVAARRLERRTEDPVGAGIVIPGTIEFGRPYAGNDRHDQTYLEGGDTFAITRGAHFVKSGFTLMDVAITGNGVDGAGGIYLFPSVDAFLAGTPASFRQTFSSAALDLNALRVGLFAQDHWTPISALSIDAGIRFDVTRLPATLAMTSHVLSPRVGVAWTPSSKWVLRAGAGIFADRIVLASLERPLLLDGHTGFEQVAEGAEAASILTETAGAALSAPLPGIPPSIYTVRSGAWDSSSRQFSVGLERGLTANLTAGVTYNIVHGHDLPRIINVNLEPPLEQDGRAIFDSTRLDPSHDGVFQLQPTAASTYSGLTFALNRRMANDIEWSAAYTWSHAIDTASDFDEQPQNPYDLSAERADSRYDQRHRFVSSALFDLPIGDEEDRKPGQTPTWWERAFGNIELAPIVTIGSGRPVNPLLGIDVGGTRAYPVVDRPLGYGRNSLELPSSATVDLRLLKSITVPPHGKLDLVVEAFNLLNRTNVTQLNAIYGAGTSPLSSFGRAIDAALARHIQFSVDFEF